MLSKDLLVKLTKYAEVQAGLSFIFFFILGIFFLDLPRRFTSLLTFGLGSFLYDSILFGYPVLALYCFLGFFTTRIIAQGRFAEISSSGELERQKKLPRKQRRFFKRSVCVVGSTNGIGLELSKMLAFLGFRVVMVARNGKLAEQRAEEIRGQDAEADLRIVLCDISELATLKQKAQEISEAATAEGFFFEVLVQNAGVLSISTLGKPKELTETGIDKDLVTNAFGPFVLTEHLIPLLLNQPSFSSSSSSSSAILLPRVIFTASIMHFEMREKGESEGTSRSVVVKLLEKSSQQDFNSYSLSKLINVMNACDISKRYTTNNNNNNNNNNEEKKKKLIACSVHPGSVATNIFGFLENIKLPFNIFTLKDVANAVLNMFFKQSNAGAQTSLHCCVDENLSDGYYADCLEMQPSELSLNDAEINAAMKYMREKCEKYL